ncbi:hypothetical protein DFP72DRAFT_848991 [Ephemerocybe angulata]|uniref:Uncharacterized protein n=1 Tax=Ephemerocybe angulata TaxID=980116 RepID=A0A8H6HVN9_9AGAR|nr:hypothetical protein DFP72DRAFT_848991 [Tulosesus angulatus]
MAFPLPTHKFRYYSIEPQDLSRVTQPASNSQYTHLSLSAVPHDVDANGQFPGPPNIDFSISPNRHEAYPPPDLQNRFFNILDHPIPQPRFPDLQKSYFQFHRHAGGSTPVPGVSKNTIYSHAVSVFRSVAGNCACRLVLTARHAIAHSERFPEVQKSHFRFHHRAEDSTPVPGVSKIQFSCTRSQYANVVTRVTSLSRRWGGREIGGIESVVGGLGNIEYSVRFQFSLIGFFWIYDLFDIGIDYVARSPTRSLSRKSDNQDFDAWPSRVPDGTCPKAKILMLNPLECGNRFIPGLPLPGPQNIGILALGSVRAQKPHVQ